MNVSASSIANTLGIGSGVDMTGLANQLAEAQFAGRNERLSSQSETLERRISLAGSIRSSLSTFASALGDRLRTGDLAPLPNISNSAVATVSSPIGTVGKGTYSLEVTQLASNQILTGPNYASGTETIGAGTLIFRFGQTSATSFTEDSATARLSIEIGPSATLNDVATAINARNGGLTAYVAQTDLGAQLVIKGTDGAKKGFIIEATEDGTNPGLSNIAWQPGGDAARAFSRHRPTPNSCSTGSPAAVPPTRSRTSRLAFRSRLRPPTPECLRRSASAIRPARSARRCRTSPAP